MNGLEIPTGTMREYLQAFGVAAIYIATPPGARPIRVGVTLDLGRTLYAIRDVWSPVVEISAAWWLKSMPQAVTLVDLVLAQLANERMDRGLLYVMGEHARTAITSIAFRQGIALNDHDAVMANVRSMVNRINREMEHALATGSLKWFNRAFKEYRLRGKDANGGRVMTYTEAWSRLRHAVILLAVTGKPYTLDRSLLASVFPAADSATGRTVTPSSHNLGESKISG